MRDKDEKAVRVLIVTKLFPNRVKPLASSFNRQQFAELAKKCEVSVIAPRPWFPGAKFLKKWSDAGDLADLPARDVVHGQAVEHPRQLYIPKFGHGIAAPLTTGSLLHLVPRYRGKIDVILASWAFPHGPSCVHLGKLLGVPVAVKVHGSDINVIAAMPGPRKSLRRWLPKANRIVAVSRELGLKCEKLGVAKDNVDLVYNGVDSSVFYPRDRAKARTALGLPSSKKIILFVGWLLETKGVLDLANAFMALQAKEPDAELIFVGEGPARQQLEGIVGNRPGVTLAGAQKLDAVADWMAACDLLCLPSWNEGTPNVVLEALASGRKVVATSVGGIPDLIQSNELGRLVPPKNPKKLSEALLSTLAEPYEPNNVSTLGSRGSWAESAEALYQSLLKTISQSK